MQWNYWLSTYISAIYVVKDSSETQTFVCIWEHTATSSSRRRPYWSLRNWLVHWRGLDFRVRTQGVIETNRTRSSGLWNRWFVWRITSRGATALNCTRVTGAKTSASQWWQIWRATWSTAVRPSGSVHVGRVSRGRISCLGIWHCLRATCRRLWRTMRRVNA